MTEIEYYINTIDEKDSDIKTNLDKVLQNPISSIVSTHHIVKFIKKNYNISQKIGCFVDYPLAFNDSSRRSDLINDAIKLEISFIAITIPFSLIINRRYDKFRDDIKKNIDLCVSKNIDIRYILEYRKFDHNLLCKICEILYFNDIKIVYPSTGFFIDNIDDNIIAAGYLNKKTGINCMVNGNIWTQSHIDSIIKSNAYGLSSNNQLIFNNIKYE